MLNWGIVLFRIVLIEIMQTWVPLSGSNGVKNSQKTTKNHQNALTVNTLYYSVQQLQLEEDRLREHSVHISLHLPG